MSSAIVRNWVRFYRSILKRQIDILFLAPAQPVILKKNEGITWGCGISFDCEGEKKGVVSL